MLLFCHVLAQEIQRVRTHRLDLNYEIAFGRGDYLEEVVEVFRWVRNKMAEAGRIVHGAEQTINIALQDAMGPLGTPGNPETLVYVARTCAEAYRHAIEWAIECKRVGVSDEAFEGTVQAASKLTANMITEIKDLMKKILRETEEAIANLPHPNEGTTVLEFNLTLTVSSVDDLNEEMDNLRYRGFRKMRKLMMKNNRS